MLNTRFIKAEWPLLGVNMDAEKTRVMLTQSSFLSDTG